MSLSGIFFLVLAGLVLLALLFVFFRIFLFLLPVALVALLILWGIGWLAAKKGHSFSLSAWWPFFGDKDFAADGQSHLKRKRARHVKVKDIKDR